MLRQSYIHCYGSDIFGYEIMAYNYSFIMASKLAGIFSGCPITRDIKFINLDHSPYFPLELKIFETNLIL